MRFLLISTAAIVSIAAANPALADEDSDWSGAYIGIHAGYTSLKSASAPVLSGAWSSEAAALQSEVVNTWSADQTVENMHFGGQLGYNVDAGGVVIGAEADFSIHNGSDRFARGPIATTPFPTLSYSYANSVDPKHSFSVRGKLGVPLGKTLIYAHGGWGWTKAEVAAEIVSNGGYTKEGRISHTFDGYLVGGGIEHKLGSNASVRLEYTYADQGDVSYVTAYRTGSAFVTPAYIETFTQDLRMHQVRVGLNYHF